MAREMGDEFQKNFDHDPFDFAASDFWQQHYQKERNEFRMELLKDELVKFKADMREIKKKLEQGGFEYCASRHLYREASKTKDHTSNGTLERGASDDISSN